MNCHLLAKVYDSKFLLRLRSLLSPVVTHLLPRNLKRLKVLTGPLKGFELYLYLRRGELSYWIGTFESSLQLAVVRLAEDTLNIRTIYDIGAHIGYFSLLLAHNFKEARIVAFEPSSDNCARLKTNILLNDLQNDIQVFPWAITDPTGEASFYTPESSWSGSLLEHHRSACKRKMVETWSLDDLVYQQLRRPI